ncbi:hypothetical protein BJF86_02590 [Serinicoccus sp. CNJ-927]|nr:hypothetical protein BJF86_02590 [Serinicoccus sp. CNJ-927]
MRSTGLGVVVILTNVLIVALVAIGFSERGFTGWWDTLRGDWSPPQVTDPYAEDEAPTTAPPTEDDTDAATTAPSTTAETTAEPEPPSVQERYTDGEDLEVLVLGDRTGTHENDWVAAWARQLTRQREVYLTSTQEADPTRYGDTASVGGDGATVTIDNASLVEGTPEYAAARLDLFVRDDPDLVLVSFGRANTPEDLPEQLGALQEELEEALPGAEVRFVVQPPRRDGQPQVTEAVRDWADDADAEIVDVARVFEDEEIVDLTVSGRDPLSVNIFGGQRWAEIVQQEVFGEPAGEGEGESAAADEGAGAPAPADPGATGDEGAGAEPPPVEPTAAPVLPTQPPVQPTSDPAPWQPPVVPVAATARPRAHGPAADRPGSPADDRAGADKPRADRSRTDRPRAHGAGPDGARAHRRAGRVRPRGRLSRRMRILLLTHYYPPETGPPQLRWSALVRDLVGAGHEVDVITPAPHYPSGQLLPGEDPAQVGHRHTGEYGETVHRVPFRPSTGTALSLLLDQGVTAAHTVLTGWRRRAELRPDVVIATVPGIPTAAAGRAVATLLRAPLVLEMRDAWPDILGGVGDPSAPLVRRAVRGAVLGAARTGVTVLQRSADLVVTTTDSFGAALRERGVARVVTVRNAHHELPGEP